jgi:hypothetical protein
MYTHVSKYKNNKIKKFKCLFLLDVWIYPTEVTVSSFLMVAICATKEVLLLSFGACGP